MHTSAGLRPRQRTFTSCTECRRRKQKCNQAKDRPCNNCARRYPPVNCVYENSSPPTIDRVVDFRDSLVVQNVLASSGPLPSYAQTTQPINSGLPATAANYYTLPSTGYYTAPTSRSEYGAYQGESSSSRNQYVAVTSAGGYATADVGYYQSSQVDYSTAGAEIGYYPTADQQAGTWLSNSDPDVFVGASPAEYYYVEPDPNQLPPTSRG